jgi:transposase InsO family protein
MDFSTQNENGERYAEAAVVTNNTEVAEKLQILFDWIGLPLILQSDNGKEFVADIITALCLINSIAIINGSVYTPNEQGAVENRNGTFKKAMSKALNDENPDQRWIDVAPLVCKSYNMSLNGATNHIPFEVIFVTPIYHL